MATTRAVASYIVSSFSLGVGHNIAEAYSVPYTVCVVLLFDIDKHKAYSNSFTSVA